MLFPKISGGNSCVVAVWIRPVTRICWVILSKLTKQAFWHRHWTFSEIDQSPPAPGKLCSFIWNTTCQTTNSKHQICDLFIQALAYLSGLGFAKSALSLFYINICNLWKQSPHFLTFSVCPKSWRNLNALPVVESQIPHRLKWRHSSGVCVHLDQKWYTNKE